MALPGSLPLALSQIKTEFGGASTLGNYHRGQLYVPNHSANSSIPTSGTIAISNFLGAEYNFTCSMTTGYDGVSTVGYYTGLVGSISRGGIGTAGNSTGQVSFDGFYDTYANIGFGPFYVTTIFVVGGTPGGFWNTVTFGSTSLSRASSNAPGGTVNGSQMYWNWSTGPYFSSGSTATFTCTL